jgi:DNA-binding transcriptional ArsR family regulator
MVDGKLLASLAHPARRAALAAIADHPSSPDDIAEATDLRLGTVAYHVRALHDAGLIVLDHEERIRGAVKHVYRLAPVNGLALHVAQLADELRLLADVLDAKKRKGTAAS